MGASNPAINWVGKFSFKHPISFRVLDPFLLPSEVKISPVTNKAVASQNKLCIDAVSE